MILMECSLANCSHVMLDMGCDPDAIKSDIMLDTILTLELTSSYATQQYQQSS
jgi:hypothetical protein